MSMRVYDVESGQLRKWKGTVDDTFIITRIFVTKINSKSAMCCEFRVEGGDLKIMTLEAIWERSIIAE